MQYGVWCMPHASSVHESSGFSTSRAPGSRTPSIIYFQPMKQTRADMLGVGVCLHSADHHGPCHRHGTVRAMSR